MPLSERKSSRKQNHISSSKDEYLAAHDAITMDKDAVVYNEDGTITLNFTK